MNAVRDLSKHNSLWWGTWSKMDETHQLLDTIAQEDDSVGPGFQRPLQTVPVVVFEEDDEFIIQATVPGFSAEHLDIVIDESHIKLSGNTHGSERVVTTKKFDLNIPEQRFEHVFELPFDIDTEGVQARISDGILEVRLPRLETES